MDTKVFIPKYNHLIDQIKKINSVKLGIVANFEKVMNRMKIIMNIWIKMKMTSHL